jgi:AAA domain/Bifunctional DNA primase/polymerase, N-terminal
LSHITLVSNKPLFAPTPDEPIVEHAIFYATCDGWSVFPLRLGEKISHKSAAHSDGRKWGQTTDANEIRRDFKQWPNANVGIVTGAVSGIFVVETDTADGHAEGTDGAAELTKLEAEHGPLPATREAESPSGSIHRYYNHPGFNIKNSASVIGPGIDVRGDGGMVVAPPSVKPGKGAYKWRNDLPIADAPQWLLDKIVAGKEKPEQKISEQAQATVRPPTGYVDHYEAYGAESHRGNGEGYIEATLNGAHDDVVRAPKGQRNPQLNDSSMWLGHFVGGGVLDEQKVIDTMLNASAASGLIADDGKAQCLATIRSGLEAGKAQPRGIPQRESAADGGQTTSNVTLMPQRTTPIHATSYVWTDPTTIRRRQWLYGNLLLRKFVSATISPGGIGKSSLIAAEALAMVSGKDLLGAEPVAPLRVWLWNLEDPLEETQRKIQAAALHYELEPDDIGDRLMVDIGREQKLVIAMATRNGAVIVQPIVDSLVDEIIKHKIDVLVIDPFVSCHEVAENDNSAMDMVLKEWGKVADLGNCAVHLVHHTRKPLGAEGETTTDSGRGASSQTDACRVVRPINRMSEKEATAAGVDNRRLYFRTINDKANLQPPVEKSDWFKLVSVDLGNGPMGMPGDSIGVVTKWEMPDALAGMTGADFEKVARVIRGGKWRHSPQAGAWVGKAVAEALDLDFDNKTVQAKIKRMLGVWYAAKSLVVVERDDESRQTRKFVEVAEVD